MTDRLRSTTLDRRKFLATSGTGMLAAVALPGALEASGVDASRSASDPTPPTNARKIPIGVFDPVYGDLSLEQMLETVSGLGLEAMEIATRSNPHCPIDELLADPAKAKAWQKKFESKGLRVAALSCHGNPLHPNVKKATADDQLFRKTVQLAQMVGVEVIVGFSGCPAGTPVDTQPNWIVYRWPPEHGEMLDWQWKEKVVPYWKDAAQFARAHGVHKIAFEMHPNMVAYNPRTLLQLREAVGPEIGANCDLSHLFWQGCDAVEVIHFLGNQGAIYHAHMKDTVFFEQNKAKYGVLNFGSEVQDLPLASETFRAVGYGHSAETWKEIVKAYMDVNFDGIMSIENEDPILPGPVGVERAAYVLKNVRKELLGD